MGVIIIKCFVTHKISKRKTAGDVEPEKGTTHTGLSTDRVRDVRSLGTEKYSDSYAKLCLFDRSILRVFFVLFLALSGTDNILK